LNPNTTAIHVLHFSSHGSSTYGQSMQ